MHLFLLIILIVMLFIVVRIGAIAFELTGLKSPIAWFQAVSCFTGTGFTTRESELIANNPQRRKIASMLMIMGYVGFVSLIATFINTMRVPEYIDKIRIPFVDFVFPARLLPLANLIVVLSAIFVLYKLFIHSKLLSRLSDSLKAYFIKKGIFATWHLEEFVLMPDGLSLMSIEIAANSPALDKKISDPYFRENNIFILALYRNTKFISLDSADLKLSLHDKVICAARIEDARILLHKDEEIIG